MTKPSQYRVNLVQDTPALKDEFGAHQRLADAIAELIDISDGGISIGLEGGWGSGKSTIINLLKDKYSKNANHTVVLFDAWAHQGDPLRRTFLETLINHLETLKWIDTKKWEEIRAELTQRRKVSVTKNIPQLGFLGGLLALSVLLIPVGLAFLNTSLKSTSGILSTDWMTWIGLGLTLIPVLILAGAFLDRGGLIWILKKIFRRPITGKSPFDNFGALIAQKHVTDTTSETIENPNPTSVEFETTFSNLMTDAITGQRRILIALDNLDRVTSSDALSILAALQTFLKPSEHHRPNWFKSLYIIIPFDPNGLRKLWKSQGEDDESKVATASLDKMFQLRFEVPPLLISDWRGYLLHLFREAFPDHDEAEFHASYRIYQIDNARKNTMPNPRDLKVFVNQIGTITRQWKTAFPLPQVAYYVILRRKLKNIPDELLKKEIPEPAYVNLLGENATDNLAAMAFNVPARQARQLLLRTPVELAFGSGDVTAAKDLSNYPGFWEVFQDVPFSDWTEKESLKVANVARCLEEGDLLKLAEPSVSKMVVASLKRAALQVKEWTPLTPESAAGMLSMVRIAPDTVLAETFINRLPPVGLDLQPSTTTSTWVQGLVQLLTGLKTVSMEVAYSQGIKMTVNAENAIELCAQIYDEDRNAQFWDKLQLVVPPEQVVAKVDSVAYTESFSERYVNAMRVMRRTGLQIAWHEAVAKITAGLKSDTVLSPAVIKNSLETLWELHDLSAPIETELGNLATQGYLLSRLHFVRTDPISAAWCIALFLIKIPSAANPPATGNSQDGYNFLTTEVFARPKDFAEITHNCVDLIAQFGKVGLLSDMLDVAPSARTWLEEGLKYASEQNYALSLFTPSMFISRWKLLNSVFQEAEYEHLVERLITQTDLLQHIAKQEFKREDAELYSQLVQRSTSNDQAFRDWCLDGLKSLDTPQWLEAFRAEVGPAELAIDLIDLGDTVSFGSSYEDALEEHGKLLIAGSAKPDYLKQHWLKLLDPLSDRARQVLRTQLVIATGRADGKISPEFFEFYGNEIADEQTLKDANNVILTLFQPLVLQRNERGLMWVDQVLNTFPNLLDAYKKHEVESFRDRIQAAIDAEGNDQNIAIENLAKRLGIQRTPPQNDGS